MSEQDFVEIQEILDYFEFKGLLKEKKLIEKLVALYVESELKSISNNVYDYILLNPDEWVPKKNIREILDKLNISDIEPWSTYSVPGEILFDIDELIR